MTRVAVCIVGLLLALLIGGHADAATYLNCGTTEPTWNAHASTLWCDDFEDGHKVVDGNGTATASNSGWKWQPFGTLEGASGFGRCGTTTGNATVVGGTPGYRGTNCAASSGNHPASAGEGQVDSMAGHDLSATNVTELHYRFFIRCIKTDASTVAYATSLTGCSWSTNTKFHVSLRGDRETGSIDYGLLYLHTENEYVGTGRCNQGASKPSGCQFGNLGFGVQYAGIELGQTKTDTFNGSGGVTANNCTSGYTCYMMGSNPNWYYIEVYWKGGASGTGTYKLWVADCGSDGTSCNSGTPETTYLRAEHTGVSLCPGAVTSGCYVNHIFNEIYSSGDGSTFVLDGEWYEDQHLAVAGNVFIGPSIESINGGSALYPVGVTGAASFSGKVTIQ